LATDKHTYTSVVCPFCGCLCYDLRVSVRDGRVVEILNGCALANSRFRQVSRRRLTRPLIRGGGEKEVSYDEAVDEAVRILTASDHPLLYGWANTTCEAQRLGIRIAEILGGAIDDTSSVCHGPTTIAVQGVGYVSATLGEVKNRADVVVYWGCNPFHAHPRHMSRYSVFPRGFFRSGRGDRKLVVVDPRRTHTARIADLHIQPKVGCDLEILNALRVLIRGEKLREKSVGGVAVEELHRLADLMTGAEFGAVFFGLGLTMSSGKHRNVEELLQLVRDLNSKAKWVVGAMRGHYNVAGFNEVCAWETGYPFSVDFSRGYPRYNPGETSAVDLIMNEEVDSILVVSSDPISHLPSEAVSKALKMPIVAIDPFSTPTTDAAKVVIPTSVAGVEVGGTAYRMDGVPVQLRPVLSPPPGMLSDEQVLDMMLERLVQ